MPCRQIQSDKWFRGVLGLSSKFREHDRELAVWVQGGLRGELVGRLRLVSGGDVQGREGKRRMPYMRDKDVFRRRCKCVLSVSGVFDIGRREYVGGKLQVFCWPYWS